ncbi:peroxisomal membrane anchor protein conserved region-domain-containing protein [Colletotrichum godetiae]|uniref:Peroxisomal membrane protein PEX14 n=1 Tax=Colletotrichum godetiae TaxID=1209918 RepID=A0AAJ0ATF7_9PEZI|nr:peroxisomal membrane anchor protein conserved region-domain-containing protein [Colletotrichum godetiae]KAK1688520.1 peroxisomal membrane anchor protein conserved region-domain-containing protein [Colletotrichum godetiae]
MSDSDDSGSTPGIPSWQRDQKKEPELEPETTTSQDAKQDDVPSREDSLEVARKFLQDEEIKDAPRAAKETFLKTKGISPEDIEQLLGSSASEPAQETTQSEQAPPSSSQLTTTSPTPSQTPSPSPPSQTEISLPRQTDQPPVITYPEFLTKPTRPPPLVTANGILNTLYAFAGISTLLYGTSKYLVQPMVENLTEARYDLHETTSQNLAKIIEKLEGTVSEIPAPKKPASAIENKDIPDDDASSADDPTEMFHRDIGTQTSIPSTPSLTTWGETNNNANSSDKDKSATDRQADKLTWFKNQAAWLKTTVVGDADDVADLKAKMDVLKDDLVQLAYPSPSDYAGGSSYALYGGPRKNEPEDEIKKARDNIRRVKGVLLSTRNFPASAR